MNATYDAVDAAPGDGTCADATGACTLRAAVMEANATPGADEMQVPAGTFVLSILGQEEDLALTGDIDITDTLTLTGAGPSATVITAAPGFHDRFFHASGLPSLAMRQLRMTAANFVPAPTNVAAEGATLLATGVPVTLDDIEVDHNVLLGSGTCVLETYYQSAVLQRVSFHDNTAELGASAACIWAMDAELRDVSVTDNSTARGTAGLSVGQEFASSVLHRVGVERNASQDGGFAGVGGSVIRIEDCCIAGNTAHEFTGGGLYLGLGGLCQATLVNTTISGNTNSRIPSDPTRPVTGAGLWFSQNFDATLNFVNCTITGNTAEDRGGGVGGWAEPTVTFSNTIVAGNSAPVVPDYDGPGTSLGHNIFGTAPSFWTRADPTDLIGVDPLLGPLQDNGGPTPTLLPLAGSPALDGGDPAGCLDETGAPLLVDQRGLPRPMDGDGDRVSRCDIGAVEVQGPDDDGDGQPNALDCAPSDPGSFALPGEPSLRVRKAPGTDDAALAWTDQAPSAGTATRYDVASDLLSTLVRTARVANGPCVQAGLAALAWVDARPVSADAWYYLVRATNACGPAAQQGWGADSFGTPHPACP